MANPNRLRTWATRRGPALIVGDTLTLSIGLFAVISSFRALTDLALATDLPTPYAYGLPWSLDAGAAAAVIYYRYIPQIKRWAGTVAAAELVLSVIGNALERVMAAGWTPGPVVSITLQIGVGAIAPLALGVTVHMTTLAHKRRRRTDTPTTTPATPARIAAVTPTAKRATPTRTQTPSRRAAGIAFATENWPVQPKDIREHLLGRGLVISKTEASRIRSEADKRMSRAAS